MYAGYLGEYSTSLTIHRISILLLVTGNHRKNVIHGSDALSDTSIECLAMEVLAELARQESSFIIIRQLESPPRWLATVHQQDRKHGTETRCASEGETFMPGRPEELRHSNLGKTEQDYEWKLSFRPKCAKC